MSELKDNGDPLLWIIHEMSGGNAVAAQQIIDEVSLHTLFLLYGIKVHSQSFIPDKT